MGKQRDWEAFRFGWRSEVDDLRYGKWNDVGWWWGRGQFLAAGWLMALSAVYGPFIGVGLEYMVVLCPLGVLLLGWLRPWPFRRKRL